MAEERSRGVRSLGDTKKAGENWTGGEDCLAVHASVNAATWLNKYMVKNGGVVDEYFVCNHANLCDTGESTDVKVAIYPVCDEVFYKFQLLHNRKLRDSDLSGIGAETMQAKDDGRAMMLLATDGLPVTTTQTKRYLVILVKERVKGKTYNEVIAAGSEEGQKQNSYFNVLSKDSVGKVYVIDNYTAITTGKDNNAAATTVSTAGNMNAGNNDNGGTDNDDNEKMCPKHLECLPPTPSDLPVMPATENRTRVSSATRHAQKVVLDTELQDDEELDANSKKVTSYSNAICTTAACINCSEHVRYLHSVPYVCGNLLLHIIHLHYTSIISGPLY